MTNIVRTRSLRLGRNWLDRSNNQADPEVAKQLASAPAGVGLVTAGIRTLRVGGLWHEFLGKTLSRFRMGLESEINPKVALKR